MSHVGPNRRASGKRIKPFAAHVRNPNLHLAELVLDPPEPGPLGVLSPVRLQQLQRVVAGHLRLEVAVGAAVVVGEGLVLGQDVGEDDQAHDDVQVLDHRPVRRAPRVVRFGQEPQFLVDRFFLQALPPEHLQNPLGRVLFRAQPQRRGLHVGLREPSADLPGLTDDKPQTFLCLHEAVVQDPPRSTVVLEVPAIGREEVQKHAGPEVAARLPHVGVERHVTRGVVAAAVLCAHDEAVEEAQGLDGVGPGADDISAEYVVFVFAAALVDALAGGEQQVGHGDGILERG
ncbi:hypothetical protein PG994_000981 [Apiospora phragmitis]|uniref:Uncharacterized protein n=1 Tax=Apiospora phragmitis TaxID=2905665 RepID=A0ABR1WR98_9PEZI